jgi:hypothetical protein
VNLTEVAVIIPDIDRLAIGDTINSTPSDPDRDERARWPDPWVTPWVTEGDSFWNWLRAPSGLASLNPDLPAGTLTNIMTVMYEQRPDLQLAYRNPTDSDRMAFVVWFLGRAQMEFQIAWGLIEPVFNSFCDYPNSMPDAHGARTNSFRCADCMQIELVCSE